MKFSKLFQIFIFVATPLISTKGFSQNRLSVNSQQQGSLAQKVIRNRAKADFHFQRNHWGIELIIAEGLRSTPESLFGHSVIRLLDDDENPWNDTVISFEMLIVDSEQTYSKAFSGGYETMPFISDLATRLVEYSSLQARGLRRVIIPSNSEKIAKLKRTVRSIIDVPDIIGDYNFMSNNCVTAILKLLNEIGYQSGQARVDFPDLLPTRIRQQLMTWSPNISIPAVTEVMEVLVCEFLQSKGSRYNCNRTGLLARLGRTSVSSGMFNLTVERADFWRYADQHGTEEQKLMLVNFFPESLMRSREEVARGRPNPFMHYIRFKMANQELLEISKFAQIMPSFPREVYLLCDVLDSSCRTARMRSILATWSPEETLQRIARYPERRNAEIRRAHQLSAAGRDPLLAWSESDIVKDMVQFALELRGLASP